MAPPLSCHFSRHISMVAFAPLALGLLMIVMGQAMAKPARMAGDAEGEHVILRAIDRHPGDLRGARRIYDRIDAAALEVCGGSNSSYSQANLAVHLSAYWHSAMKHALAQVSTPSSGRGGARQIARAP